MQRFGYAIAVLLGVTALVFSLVHLSGDPLAGLLPPGSSPEQAASIREQLGLDRPLPVQYASFLARLASGDLGQSWRQGRPALEAVVERLPYTLALGATAIAIASIVGLSLGVASGARPGGVADLTARSFAALGQAVPGFWLGTLLILIFAVRLHWLPSSGMRSVGSLVLPSLALAAYPAAVLTRLVRSSLIETMDQDFIRTARAKGLPGTSVIQVHALRNALLPALAYAGVQIGYLVGGAIVIEGVFAYPGIGQLALAAVADRDLPVIQAFVIVVATLIVFANMMVDVAARWLDPRLAEPASAAVKGA
jgi:peptide/nickel transport system permease protein